MGHFIFSQKHFIEVLQMPHWASKHCTIHRRQCLAFSQALQKCRAVAVSYSWALDLLPPKTTRNQRSGFDRVCRVHARELLCVLRLCDYNSREQFQLSNFNKESNSYSRHIRMNTIILIFGSLCAQLEPIFTLWNMLHYAGHQDYRQLITSKNVYNLFYIYIYFSDQLWSWCFMNSR